MADISAGFPVTEPDRHSWPGAGWLRIAVLAGIAAGLIAAAFNLGVAERVLDNAIALESAPVATASVDGEGAPDHGEVGHTHGGLVAEPFTRDQQKGGMIIGQGVVGLALGLLLAGVALMLGRSTLTPQRFWLALVAAGAWALLILPALKYPPLPPGVETVLDIDERQINYLLLVVAGGGSVLIASAIWTRLSGNGARTFGPFGSVATRVVSVGAVLIAPVLVAFLLLPPDEIAVSFDSGVLTRFRLVAIGSQALFWVVLAVLGLWLLEHRRLPSFARRRTADA